MMVYALSGIGLVIVIVLWLGWQLGRQLYVLHRRPWLSVLQDTEEYPKPRNKGF